MCALVCERKRDMKREFLCVFAHTHHTHTHTHTHTALSVVMLCTVISFIFLFVGTFVESCPPVFWWPKKNQKTRMITLIQH